MKRTYVELSCDQCHQADYYYPGHVDATARANGWVITRDGKHFCDSKCQDEYEKSHRKAS